MMISAPNTPSGAAFLHFWQLFARRPLNLPHLQEAFVSLGDLARKEQPTMPWPTTIGTGDGERIPFKVESLLADFAQKAKRKYAGRAAVSDQTIQALLLRWTGSTIKEVVVGWQGAGFQIRLAKKIHLPSKSTRTQQVGSLGVVCTWQLLQEQKLVCSSNDTDLHLAESLPVLKGKKLLDSHLSAGGRLLLTLQAGFQLAIQPDSLAINADYFLDFGWNDQCMLFYDCFEGAFVPFEQDDSEQDILDNP
jgi:hypothetical protein